MPFSLMRRLLPLLLCTVLSPAAWAMPPLVDSDWLATHLEDSQLVLLDVQSPEYYRQVHLPGAVSAPFRQWRVKSAAGLPGMLPPIPQLEALLGQLGISPSHAIVIVVTGFGAGDMAAAARVYWTLQLLGHRQVAILNGGLADFASDERRAARLTDSPARRAVVSYQASPDLSLLADAAGTQTAIQDGQQLIDARSAAEFLGIHVAGDKERYGALPRAVNLPFDWLTANGTAVLPSTARLRRLLQAVGVDPQAPQVHYCHSGNRAALSWFVAYALLGNRQARLYDGSMLEWAVREDLPMERRVEF
jgi:thiosulfate/3-mercaptopyruvate sulfurtransferase